jgi:hypothetical protein
MAPFAVLYRQYPLILPDPVALNTNLWSNDFASGFGGSIAPTMVAFSGSWLSTAMSVTDLGPTKEPSIHPSLPTVP